MELQNLVLNQTLEMLHGATATFCGPSEWKWLLHDECKS